MEVTYVGPHTGVEIDDIATGYHATVGHGKTVELPDAVARGLLEQGPEHWKPKPKMTKKKED